MTFHESSLYNLQAVEFPHIVQLLVQLSQILSPHRHAFEMRADLAGWTRIQESLARVIGLVSNVLSHPDAYRLKNQLSLSPISSHALHVAFSTLVNWFAVAKPDEADSTEVDVRPAQLWTSVERLLLVVSEVEDNCKHVCRLFEFT